MTSRDTYVLSVATHQLMSYQISIHQYNVNMIRLVTSQLSHMVFIGQPFVLAELPENVVMFRTSLDMFPQLQDKKSVSCISLDKSFLCSSAEGVPPIRALWSPSCTALVYSTSLQYQAFEAPPFIYLLSSLNVHCLIRVWLERVMYKVLAELWSLQKEMTDTRCHIKHRPFPINMLLAIFSQQLVSSQAFSKQLLEPILFLLYSWRHFFV